MEGTRASRGGGRLCRESRRIPLDSEHGAVEFKRSGHPALFNLRFFSERNRRAQTSRSAPGGSYSVDGCEDRRGLRVLGGIVAQEMEVLREDIIASVDERQVAVCVQANCDTGCIG